MDSGQTQKVVSIDTLKNHRRTVLSRNLWWVFWIWSLWVSAAAAFMILTDKFEKNIPLHDSITNALEEKAKAIPWWYDPSVAGLWEYYTSLRKWMMKLTAQELTWDWSVDTQEIQAMIRRDKLVKSLWLNDQEVEAWSEVFMEFESEIQNEVEIAIAHYEQQHSHSENPMSSNWENISKSNDDVFDLARDSDGQGGIHRKSSAPDTDEVDVFWDELFDEEVLDSFWTSSWSTENEVWRLAVMTSIGSDILDRLADINATVCEYIAPVDAVRQMAKEYSDNPKVQRIILVVVLWLWRSMLTYLWITTLDAKRTLWNKKPLWITKDTKLFWRIRNEYLRNTKKRRVIKALVSLSVWFFLSYTYWTLKQETLTQPDPAPIPEQPKKKPDSDKENIAPVTVYTDTLPSSTQWDIPWTTSSPTPNKKPVISSWNNLSREKQIIRDKIAKSEQLHFQDFEWLTDYSLTTELLRIPEEVAEVVTQKDVRLYKLRIRINNYAANWNTALQITQLLRNGENLPIDRKLLECMLRDEEILTEEPWRQDYMINGSQLQKEIPWASSWQDVFEEVWPAFYNYYDVNNPTAYDKLSLWFWERTTVFMNWLTQSVTTDQLLPIIQALAAWDNKSAWDELEKMYPFGWDRSIYWFTENGGSE